jgi:hypothetical protein
LVRPNDSVAGQRCKVQINPIAGLGQICRITGFGPILPDLAQLYQLALQRIGSYLGLNRRDPSGRSDQARIGNTTSF